MERSTRNLIRLLDLTTVAAVIFVFTSVVLPAYQDYVLEHRFSEQTSPAVKQAIEFCSQDDRCVERRNAAGVVFGEDFIMKPTMNADGSVRWVLTPARQTLWF